MECPICGARSIVKDGVYIPEENKRLRKRTCPDCQFTFLTVETVGDYTDKDLQQAWYEHHRLRELKYKQCKKVFKERLK